jgi:membrane protein implicated in regulation of membrane protease activity
MAILFLFFSLLLILLGRRHRGRVDSRNLFVIFFEL